MLLSEVNKPKTKTVTVESFFADKNIELTFCNEKDAVAPVESLAFTIAINFPHTKPFVRFLRDCINKKSFDFTYSVAAFSPADKIAIISLAEKLNRYVLVFGKDKLPTIVINGEDTAMNLEISKAVTERGFEGEILFTDDLSMFGPGFSTCLYSFDSHGKKIKYTIVNEEREAI